ncbi:hypothetical protein D3C79_967960 [compost metagenome]
MIEPRRADVIGPAITAHYPDRTAHQLINQGDQLAGLAGFHLFQPLPHLGHPAPLGADLRLQPLRGVDKRLDQCLPQLPLHRLEGGNRLTMMLIGGETKTKAKLGIVLEQ